MPGNRRHLFIASASVLIGISLAIGILFLGEIIVRVTTNVIFLGNSSNLFEAKRFGQSIGNAPNIRGLAFHEPAYTDSYGFRIPNPGYRYPSAPRDKILILGDSVAFGPGVAEEKTFVGRLRASRPDSAIFNAAVIGYGVNDYLNVVRALLDKGSQYTVVLLVFCLNDVSSDSARLLDSSAVPQRFSAVERLRNLTFAAAANEWLRENSKLYLYVKGVVTDPSARYFLADYLNYDGRVDQKLGGVVELAAELSRAGIPLYIVISPYEYQLRTRDGVGPKDPIADDVMLPQRRIADFWGDKGLATYDSAGFFLSQVGRASSEYFLPSDPMHFSERGHAVMHRYIENVLRLTKLP